MLAKTTLKEGPGLPLVFFHGFLGSAADWHPVCSHLPSCKCIGFDLPGHGHSAWTVDFEIDLPRFHLIGYSMGGRIALSYAARHPEQIASLTLLSTHPGLPSEEEKQQRFQEDQKWAQLLLELPIDEFLFRWYDQSIFRPYKPDFNMRRQQNKETLSKALLHYSLAHQKRYRIEEGLVGERDEKFKALYPRPILIPDAGHMVHLENPAAVSAEIQKRIDR